MQRAYGVYLDSYGRPINGATVSVYQSGTSTLASIYSATGDPSAPSGQANPFTTDATGFWGFSAAIGRYDIVVSSTVAATRNYPNVFLSDVGGPYLANPMTTKGDMIAGGLAGAVTRVPGNATATPMYVYSANGALPVFKQVAATEVSGLAAFIAANGVASFNGRIGIVFPATNDYSVGQVTGAAPLASPTFTGTATIPTAVITNITLPNNVVNFGGSISPPSSGDYTGINVDYVANTSITTGRMINLRSELEYASSGTNAGDVCGVYAAGVNTGTGSITGILAGAVGIYAIKGGGTVTNAACFNAFTPSLPINGTITNGYGIRIEGQAEVGITNSYGVFQVGANDLNYFAGNVGIGTQAPTQPLQVVGSSTGILTLGESSSTTGKQMLIGISTAGSGFGSIQSVFQGTGYTPLALNASGGNVGIGTNNPTLATFQVVGSIQASTTVTATSFSGAGTGLTGTAASLTAGNATTATTATAANGLNSATTTVNLSAATAPTVGQVPTATSGTAATWQTPGSSLAFATKTSTAPTATSTTTFVMMGLACSFTPGLTGRVVFIGSGQMQNSNLNDGATVQLYYGTGTPPINGAALPGPAVGIAISQTHTSLVAGDSGGWSFVFPINTLTVGTTYWLDVALEAVTAGNASVTGVTLAVFER